MQILETLRLSSIRARISGGELSSLKNFAALDAGGANPNPLGTAVDNGTHFLQIEVPTPFGDVVCVAHFVSELRAAAACFALSRHKTEISLWFLNQ
jgi:hypothetical protein